MSVESNQFLVYEGCNFLRQRLILSILSGRPIKISQIRSFDDSPGLKDYEICLLKLLDIVTNGSKVEINQTGTELIFSPGMLSGGDVEFDCDLNRCISYYLEPLIYLAPFVKQPIKALLRGVTNNQIESSVDLLRATWTPVMRRFLLDDEGLEIKVNKRGLSPNGGGEAYFFSPLCRQSLRPIQLCKLAKIRRIRGVAFACRVSPLMANRMIESARKVITQFVTDVYITADHRKGASGGNSAGFGIVLTAEYTNDCVLAAEVMSKPRGESSEPSIPEDIGTEAAHRLLEEIYRGGCVDSSAQSLATLFMALGQKDVSDLVCGPLSTYSVHMLRHMRDFLDVKFKIGNYENQSSESDEQLRLGSEDKVKMICVGVGYTNLSKVLL